MEMEQGSLAPFLAIDSSTIQSSMAESLLFGHEKGLLPEPTELPREFSRNLMEESFTLMKSRICLSTFKPNSFRILQEKEVFV